MHAKIRSVRYLSLASNNKFYIQELAIHELKSLT